MQARVSGVFALKEQLQLTFFTLPMDSAVEGTPRYYALCAIGGMLSAGTTHLAITPFDVLKVNMQVYRFLGFHFL